MKIYISGGITNVPNFMERFAEAEKRLKEWGYEVINPTMVTLPKSCTHDDYMKVDLQLLDIADGIYMLNGWDKSKGACIEHGFALGKDKVIMFEKE